MLFDRAAVVVDDSPQTLEQAAARRALSAGLLFPWNRFSAGRGFALFGDLNEVLGYIVQRRSVRE